MRRFNLVLRYSRLTEGLRRRLCERVSSDFAHQLAPDRSSKVLKRFHFHEKSAFSPDHPLGEMLLQIDAGQGAKIIFLRMDRQTVDRYAIRDSLITREAGIIEIAGAVAGNIDLHLGAIKRVGQN